MKNKKQQMNPPTAAPAKKPPVAATTTHIKACSDSGTVAATLLWGAYGAEPWSCRWITRPRPAVSDDGLYLDQPDGAPMRLFTHLDMRLLMEDFYARLALHAAGTERIAP